MNQLKDSTSQKDRGKVVLERWIVYRAFIAEEDRAVLTESVILGIPRNAKRVSRSSAPLGKDCGCVHTVETRWFEESSTQRKRQRTNKCPKKFRISVKIGNQRPCHKPWKSKQSEEK